MHGGRGFIRQTSQANKALQDQEEWINELKRFDFDRIHSTTNLRTYALIQPLEEPSSPTTRIIWPHSDKMEISSFMSHHTLLIPTLFGKPTLLEKVMLLTESQLKTTGILFFMTLRILSFGHQDQLEREMLPTLCCSVTKEILNGMVLWENSNGNLDQSDIDLLDKQISQSI